MPEAVAVSPETALGGTLSRGAEICSVAPPASCPRSWIEMPLKRIAEDL